MDIIEKVELGGFRQKIHIKTNDQNKSVLLFLHGGPGVCNRHGVMVNHNDLTDTFTLVAWDQRGSGGSYFGSKKQGLTVRRLVDDAHELVLYLCKKFNKKKIFILGGSWGSQLGTLLAFHYPENLAAYVGLGQVVNGTRNEELSYNFALEAAEKAGDEKAITALKQVGPPEKGVYKGGFKGMMTQRRVMMKYGGYSQNKAKRSYFRTMVIPIFFSGEYTPLDILGIIRGYKYSLTVLWPEVGGTDLAVECPAFKIPYYIFDGRLDKNTPAELVEDYFNTISAPEKELVWFENSGHNPMGDEPERFKSLLREKLSAIAEREDGV
jgi:pimeloyl-ACP methyl ester carboxylesterase